MILRNKNIIKLLLFTIYLVCLVSVVLISKNNEIKIKLINDLCIILKQFKKPTFTFNNN